ncbi:hypothetical protein [Achromobacter agilis]|uniref:hypothetical protein n=1 Tax=Achromobacter agilis TaxID=1353888 RepID=UPI0010122264|nr:hypothetical protein [Achromobacter agilis]
MVILALLTKDFLHVVSLGAGRPRDHSPADQNARADVTSHPGLWDWLALDQSPALSAAGDKLLGVLICI